MHHSVNEILFNFNVSIMKKIKNYYYLVVGILSVLAAFTHALNGQQTVLQEMGTTTLSEGTQTIFRYVWHIITAENLIFGVALIMMAFFRERGKVRFAALFIATVLLTRWLVILLFTMSADNAGFAGILTDTVGILLFVILLLLGSGVGRRKQSLSN